MFQESGRIADVRVADVQSQADLLLTQKEDVRRSLKDQLRAANAQLQSRDADARDYYQRLTFGHSIANAEPPLDQPHLLGVVTSLHELRPTIVELIQSSESVWGAIVGEAGAQDPASPMAWLTEYVQANEPARMAAAFAELKTVLDRYDDPGAMLLVAYR
jgi:hypothetical protein